MFKFRKKNKSQKKNVKTNLTYKIKVKLQKIFVDTEKKINYLPRVKIILFIYFPT